MQTMQRKFGRFLPRTADEAQVGVLLKDFEDADKMLSKLIDATKAWRDSWKDIFTIQHRLVDEFHTLYSPIIGAGEGYSGHEPVETPQETLERVAKLKEAYAELKTDLLEEVNQVDTRITNPASEAKEYLQPMKKVIKKRQDRKLDFERYQGRYDAAHKKTKRTERENAALAKHESDLARAKEEYTVADDKLKASLPPLIIAAYSILPHLLAAQIMIQNTLISQYYTLLHNYCQEENFPSPPPPMIEVIAMWDNQFRPAQHDIEAGIACVAGGKTVRQPMKLEDRQTSGSLTGLNIRNGFAQRKSSHQNNNELRPSISPARSEKSGPPSPNFDSRPSPNLDTRPRISSVPSQSSLALSVPNYSSSNPTSPSPSELYTPQSHAPAGPRSDYFSRDRNPSSSSAAMTSAAAMKKKPPPPPPKRVPSAQAIWVTALYDFKGQGEGDLVFHEGDRIKVVKKTESTDDWWEGELKGVQGSFPANYCQAV